MTKVPLVFVDERYSSAEAELLIWKRGESPSKRKQPLDSLAAQIILQSYLDDPSRVIPPPTNLKQPGPTDTLIPTELPDSPIAEGE